jgi:hypothetical protein
LDLRKNPESARRFRLPRLRTVTTSVLPTKGNEDADVAHALVRAVFALLRTQSCEKERRSHACERGTQSACATVGAFHSASWKLALLLLSPILQAEIIDRIAISVGNQVITESQIVEEIRLTAFLNEDKLNLDNEERKKSAGRLIEQTLVRREMEFSRYPLPALSDAAQPLEILKARYKTDVEYQQALDSYGITEDGLKRRLWWQATFLRFIDYRFRPGIQIPEADVRAHYQQQLDKWKQEGVAPVPSLEDVRPSIERTLTDQRIDQAVDRWLADTRTQVNIRFHDEALQ